MAVPKISALPNPWTPRTAIMAAVDGTSVMASDATVKTEIPARKTFFRPWMSAMRPKGTMKTAVARRYAVAIQERATASMWNSAPIWGRAMFTADPSNGVMNPARRAMRRTIRFSVSIGAGGGAGQTSGSPGDRPCVLSGSGTVLSDLPRSVINVPVAGGDQGEGRTARADRVLRSETRIRDAEGEI